MSLTVREITENVFLVEADSQYEITSTFMRLEEFYESPFKEIRRKFFTHEQFMDLYARENGKFSYFEDWAGFNVPCDAYNNWVKVFSKKDLSEKEKTLIKLINSVKNNNKFCIVGTCKDKNNQDYARIFDHELSHAWFYLDIEYKREMLRLVRSLKKISRQQITNQLTEDGYSKNCFEDEIIAYLATSPMTMIAEFFEDDIPWDKVYEFQDLFEEFKEEKFDENN